MLELADKRAAHPERLAELIEADRKRSWRAPGGPPKGLLRRRRNSSGRGGLSRRVRCLDPRDKRDANGR